MQKIAINRAIGGFTLTPLALLKYYEKKGVKIFIYENVLQMPEMIMHLKRLTAKKIMSGKFSRIGGHDIYTKDMGAYIKRDDAEQFWETDRVWYECEIDKAEFRTDPDLIEILEELGQEGTYDEHKIVEIPDDVEWEIHSSDEGYEWVAEKHRTWR